MNVVSRCYIALLLAGASATVYAAGAADAVNVVDATVRLMPPGARATAAFMTLRNGGDKDVKLVKAETPAAKIAELHTHINENGVMKMRQVQAVEIKAKGETRLAPGGNHIMLFDPTSLKEGEITAITLGFDDGSSKKIDAVVKKPAAAPAMMNQSGHMDHSGHGQKH